VVTATPRARTPTRLIYYGAFNPPTVMHRDQLRKAVDQHRPAHVVIAPVDHSDGTVTARRWLRTRYAHLLAAAAELDVPVETTELALTCRTVPATMALLSRNHHSVLVVAVDTPPELQPSPDYPTSPTLSVVHLHTRHPAAPSVPLPTAMHLQQTLSR